MVDFLTHTLKKKMVLSDETELEEGGGGGGVFEHLLRYWYYDLNILG